MSEHRELPNMDDRDLLDNIERVLAGESDDEHDSASLEGFAARLAGSAPEADEEFRTQLYARLSREMYAAGQGIQTSRSSAYPSIAARTVAPQYGPRLPAGSAAGKQPGRARLSGPARLLEPLRPAAARARGQRRGRLAGATLGLMGAAAMVLLLVAMGIMFRLRSEVNKASGTPTAVAVVPADSRQLVSAMQPLRTLSAGPPQYMAWSPDGSILAAADKTSEEYTEYSGPRFTYTLRAWEARTGVLRWTLSYVNICTLSWSPDGATLAVGLDKNTVRLLDPETGTDKASLIAPVPAEGTATPGLPTDIPMPQPTGWDPNNSGWVRSVAWSPDSKKLATAAYDPYSLEPITRDGVVRLWDAATGKLLRAMRILKDNSPDVSYYDRYATDVRWPPTGQTFAAHSFDGKVRIWDRDTGDLVRVVPGESWDLLSKYAVDWSPDGSKLALTAGQQVEVWDAQSGTLLRRMPEILPPTPLPTNPPPFAPTAYPTNEPPPPMIMATPQGIDPDNDFTHLFGVDWSPDGKMLATAGGSGRLRLWDPATGEKLHTMESPGYVMGWAPDSKVLATGSDDGTMPRGSIIFWDPVSGKELRRIHEGKAGAFAWSPDGSTLAAGSDGGITIWGLAEQPTAEPTQAGTPIPAPTLPPASPCGAWQVVPSEDPGQVNVLHAVAALSPDDAWAAGYYSNDSLSDTDLSMHEGAGARTLIERWDGKEWRVVPSPNVGAGSNYLRGLAAVSSGDVWAVGYYTATTRIGDIEQTLIERWDGLEWRIVPSPNVKGVDNRLAAVASVSADDVWAVGSYGDNYTHDKPAPNPAQTLILHWDGREWSIVPSPSPTKYTNRLYSVAALDANNAWAVGYQLTSPGNSAETRESEPLILRWNGAEWSEEPASGLISYGFLQYNLTGVTTAGKDQVVAVGILSGGGSTMPLVVPRTGNEGQWYAHTAAIFQSLRTPVSLIPKSMLSEVVAVAPDDIWAVGTSVLQDGGREWSETFTLRYDGNVWEQVASPNGGSKLAGLFDVAPDGMGGAWAVGYHGPHESHRTLIMRHDGARCPRPTPSAESVPVPIGSPVTITPSPEPSPSPQAQADCKGEVVSSPNAGKINELQAVAAVSADDIWAVGYQSPAPDSGPQPGISKSLIMHWDGARWAVVPSPNAGTSHNQLTGVTTASANDVWAVGYYADYSTDADSTNPGVKLQTLVMHWDGKEWKIVPSPDADEGGSRFNAVYAASANDVWAVGYYDVPFDGDPNKLITTISKSLVMHWDGREWRIVPSPDPGQYRNRLYAVSGAETGQVWAVGEQSNSGPLSGPFGYVSYPLALLWNGSEWAEVPLPRVDKYGFFQPLTGVTALSHNEAWAVGSSNSEGSSETFAMHWNGSAWKLFDVPVPTPPSGLPHLESPHAIAATSPDDVWAVGAYNDYRRDFESRTLVAHWDGTRWRAIDGPNPATQSGDKSQYNVERNSLTGVAVLSGGEAWAVGSMSVTGDSSQTLTVRYPSAPCSP